MARTYYHATRTELTTLRASAFCVTSDESAALEYLEGESGHLYEVTLRDGLRLADAGDVRSIARELVPDSPYNRVYELIEEHRVVREALIAAGYDGAEYEDETPDNATSHDTVMVFDASRCVEFVREIA